MVKAVRDGGGKLTMICDPDPDPNHGAKFLRDNPGVKLAREEREALDDPEIALIVVIPAGVVELDEAHAALDHPRRRTCGTVRRQD